MNKKIWWSYPRAPAVKHLELPSGRRMQPSRAGMKPMTLPILSQTQSCKAHKCLIQMSEGEHLLFQKPCQMASKQSWSPRLSKTPNSASPQRSSRFLSSSYFWSPRRQQKLVSAPNWSPESQTKRTKRGKAKAIDVCLQIAVSLRVLFA